MLALVPRQQAYAAIAAKKKNPKTLEVDAKQNISPDRVMVFFFLSSTIQAVKVIPPIKTEEISVAQNESITVLHRELNTRFRL